MLTRLSVKGFKTLVDFDVPLSKVTVLVGPNNCGKSNVLKALDFVAAVVRGGMSTAFRDFGGAESLRTRHIDVPFRFEISASVGESELRYVLGTNQEHLELTGSESATLTFQSPQSTLLLGNVRFALPTAAAGDALRTATHIANCPLAIRHFFKLISGVTVADFSTSALRRPSQIVQDPKLQQSGEGLAAVLDQLDGDRPSVRERINQEVHSAIPRVTKVVTKTVEQPGMKVVAVAEGDNVFAADNVSDGVLLFIALSTVAQMSGGQALVGLEEPDRGIHPRRIREVLDQIYGLANAGSQFILTTHSPVLLNEFRDYPESVLILDRDDSGTHAKRLSELPDVEAQLKDVQLGDLWYSGVLGGVPKR